MRSISRLFVSSLLLAAAIVGVATPARAATTTIAVDGSSPGLVFGGVGALSAGASSRLLIDYPEPQRSQLLDYLFRPGYGAALQVLKVEIGGDTNSTDGTEPSHMHTATDLNCNRGYEWWLMEQAKARNPNIALSALAWGAPGWVGDGKQTVWTDHFIDYLLTWLGCARQHGLTIDYLGGWNEKGFDAGWDVKLRQALDSHGYGGIKIVADDSFSWTVVNALSTDQAFADAVDVVGQHYVCGYLGDYRDCPSPQAAQDLDKPLWASEQGSEPYDTGAAPLARAINRQYTDGRMVGTVNWSLEWSAYDGLPFPGDGLLLANEPWSGHYVIGQSIWATAQTTQFTQPGWRYLDSGSTRIDGGSVVSLRSPDSGDWSSIAETLDASAPQQVDFGVSGGLSTGTVHVWSTDLNSSNPADWFVRQPDVAPQDGHFTATLQPGRVYTFTTTTGQGHGSATSPPAKAWQLPYSDNFDKYPTDATPRYVSDLGGTFATAPCQGGRTGECLRNVVNVQPVRWNNTANLPLTVVGDPHNWHNYQVGVDALLEQDGSVDVGGRVINGVSGYHFVVRSDGTWTLRKATSTGAATTLASGTTSFRIGTWHRLTLTMRTLDVTAAIDGRTLATVGDSTYDTGQVSLGASAWQNAEFDNLVITPAPDAASKLSLHDITPVYVPTPGGSTDVSAQVTNPGPVVATDLRLTVDGPQGWTVTPTASGGTSLAPGNTATWSWHVTAPADAQPGRYAGTIALHYSSGGEHADDTRSLPFLLGVIPHDGMTATSDSFQAHYADWCCEPHFAIDDNPNTLWHTQFSPYDPLPRQITLDLGKSYDVRGLRYVPRQDNNHNGVITSYAVLVSEDGTNFTQVTSGDWADDFATKVADFDVHTARYVRLTAVAGHAGLASAAEIDVLGTPGGGA
ncbi:MAG TPA: discoidin domain-containing protein [Jatrophihabitans sp.]|nr:discoidin domain-containing protein [Jatrophihabitans sp.]